MTRNPQAVIPGGGPQQSSVPKGAAGSSYRMGDCPDGHRATREPSRVSPSRPFGRVSAIAAQVADAFALAIAVFCIVYFGLRELLAVLS